MITRHRLSCEVVQAMGAAVTAAAKQHKLAKAAVYLPDSSTPLTVSMLLRQSQDHLRSS